MKKKEKLIIAEKPRAIKLSWFIMPREVFDRTFLYAKTYTQGDASYIEIMFTTGLQALKYPTNNVGYDWTKLLNYIY